MTSIVSLLCRACVRTPRTREAHLIRTRSAAPLRHVRLRFLVPRSNEELRLQVHALGGGVNEPVQVKTAELERARRVMRRLQTENDELQL